MASFGLSAIARGILQIESRTIQWQPNCQEQRNARACITLLGDNCVGGTAVAGLMTFGCRFVPYARLTSLTAFATCASLLIWRRLNEKSRPADPEAVRGDDMSLRPEIPNVLQELTLAIEHIESITVLLEIARLHKQHVPAAVLSNLELVLKSLRKVQCEQPSLRSA